MNCLSERTCARAASHPPRLGVQTEPRRPSDSRLTYPQTGQRPTGEAGTYLGTWQTVDRGGAVREGPLRSRALLQPTSEAPAPSSDSAVAVDVLDQSEIDVLLAALASEAGATAATLRPPVGAIGLRGSATRAPGRTKGSGVRRQRAELLCILWPAWSWRKAPPPRGLGQGPSGPQARPASATARARAARNGTKSPCAIMRRGRARLPPSRG